MFSCWKYLNPLVCGIHYRPCTFRLYTEDGENTTVQKEVMQIYPHWFCYAAEKKCSFLKDHGLWLPQFNCENIKASLSNANETSNNVLGSRRLLIDDSKNCLVEYSVTFNLSNYPILGALQHVDAALAV